MPKRPSFGSVGKEKSRPGWYVRFTCQDWRVKKSAGLASKHVPRKLSQDQTPRTLGHPPGHPPAHARGRCVGARGRWVVRGPTSKALKT